MPDRVAKIIDLKSQWVAQATPDHLSAVIYCGIESVCVVGGKDADVSNQVIDHIVALRECAVASANFCEAVAGYEQVKYCETPQDDEAIEKANVHMSDMRSILDIALVNAGDQLSIKRQAALHSEWEEVPVE